MTHTQHKRPWENLVPVILLSVLSLEAAVLAARLLQPWESASADMFMRWRYHLTPSAGRTPRQDITLLAVDRRTLNEFGRFGAGEWLARRPFCNQIEFFRRYFQPTVVAYDILFQETQGGTSHGYRVSESPRRTAEISEAVKSLSEHPGRMLSPPLLYDMNKLSMEQGSTLFAMTLAGLLGKGTTEIMLACYFRGGWVDPQPVRIERLTEGNVPAVDGRGKENSGLIVPYLKDTAIPDTDVHFRSDKARECYVFSPNGSFPDRQLFDYAYLGFVNCPRDADNIIRRVPVVLGVRYYETTTGRAREIFLPSFALAACILHLGLEFPLEPGDVEVFMGEEVILHVPGGPDLKIPIDGKGSMYLNFTAQFSDFKAVSYVDAAPPVRALSMGTLQKLAERLRKDIDGHLVMVGVPATGIDVGPCPLSDRTPLVHIHMTAAENILSGNHLVEPGKTVGYLITGLVWVLFTGVCLLERTARLGPSAIMFAALYVVGAYGAVHASWIVMPLVTPVFYISLCSFTVMSYRFFTEERAKRRIRGMFSTMVSDKVLSYLEENPESFSLQGHDTQATVLFADIEGFTAISERLSPERLTNLLNQYLTPITDCIMEHGGYVDKYVGDSVMGVWGAPYPDKDHAAQACLSALEQQKIVKKLSREISDDYGVGLKVRIGINSGTVTAGNMGSEKKFQYTVIGDTVNLASRLEPVNKDFGTRIIIGEVTRTGLGANMVTRELGRIAVAGKKEIVSIYELVGATGEIPEELFETIRSYECALAAFHKREWDRCIEIIQRVLDKSPQDGPSILLSRRARTCRDQQPPPGWQGEYIRTEKE
ncbi:MAG: adenylate/guanylate cyclase domain-containing protein [Kiritimatiellia bacterium]